MAGLSSMKPPLCVGENIQHSQQTLSAFLHNWHFDISTFVSVDQLPTLHCLHMHWFLLQKWLPHISHSHYSSKLAFWINKLPLINCNNLWVIPSLEILALWMSKVIVFWLVEKSHYSCESCHQNQFIERRKLSVSCLIRPSGQGIHLPIFPHGFMREFLGIIPAEISS